MSVVPDSHDPNSQGSLTPPVVAAESAPAILDVQSVMSDIPQLQSLAYALGDGARSRISRLVYR